MNVVITDNTTQGLFNLAIAGVLAQGERCTNDGECMYRSYEGPQELACAVGHLMTEEAIDEYGDMYGESARSDTVASAVEHSIGRVLTEDDLELMANLQEFHDRAYEELQYFWGLSRDYYANLSTAQSNKLQMAKFLLQCNQWADSFGLQRFHRVL